MTAFVNGKAVVKTPVFKEAPDSGTNPLTEVIKATIDALKQLGPSNQDVIAEGVNQGVAQLTTADVDTVIASAQQYWRNLGASASVLSNVEISIGLLPTAVAAQTQANQITLSADGAGWGWFVDGTPADSSEFTALSGNEWQAPADSAANGKLDLLTVLIHEIGHALGLEHSDAGTMEGVVQPGERHLPAAEEAALMQNLRNVVTAQTKTAIHSLAVTQYQRVANPTLTNSDLNSAVGWDSLGDVAIGNGLAVLDESATAQTQLSQTFIIGPDDRVLSFKANGLSLHHATGGQSGPGDAFEVALLDANSLEPLTGTAGLSHSDALLNIQADGTEKSASGLRRFDSADGSKTYTLDVSSIAAGTAVTLFFDLLGFGAVDSSVILSNIQLQDMTLQTRDDQATLTEDSPATIAVLDNDTFAQGAGFLPVVVVAPAHGEVVTNPDGTLVYTPAKDYFGPDAFSYQLKDGLSESNVAAVSVNVTSVNDAPVAVADAAVTGEDQSVSANVLANDTDVEHDPLTAILVAGPVHGNLVLNANGSFTYTPVADFNGTDSFTYKANDGLLDSNLATVNLTINPVNDAPLGANATLITLEDTSLIIKAGDVTTRALSKQPLQPRRFE